MCYYVDLHQNGWNWFTAVCSLQYAWNLPDFVLYCDDWTELRALILIGQSIWLITYVNHK